MRLKKPQNISQAKRQTPLKKKKDMCKICQGSPYRANQAHLPIGLSFNAADIMAPPNFKSIYLINS